MIVGVLAWASIQLLVIKKELGEQGDAASRPSWNHGQGITSMLVCKCLYVASKTDCKSILRQVYRLLTGFFAFLDHCHFKHSHCYFNSSARVTRRGGHQGLRVSGQIFDGLETFGGHRSRIHQSWKQSHGIDRQKICLELMAELLSH